MVLFMPYPHDIDRSPENYNWGTIFTNHNFASDNLIAVEFQLSICDFSHQLQKEHDGIMQPSESTVHYKLTYIQT